MVIQFNVHDGDHITKHVLKSEESHDRNMPYFTHAISEKGYLYFEELPRGLGIDRTTEEFQELVKLYFYRKIDYVNVYPDPVRNTMNVNISLMPPEDA